MAQDSLIRYAKQVRLAEIGESGQRRLTLSAVAIVGCGALGSAVASTLVRAGVGAVRLIDRDFVEIDNLQRQFLYDEIDVAEQLPKAEAAARKLHRINSSIEIEPRVADLAADNVDQLCRGVDLLIDGTDNLETRYLINDYAVKTEVPWVYGGCVGMEGLVLAVRPFETPCLRCFFPDPPPPGSLPTCETAGVFGPTVQLVAALQSAAAIRLLIGRLPVELNTLQRVSAWGAMPRPLDASPGRCLAECTCCGKRQYEFLDRAPGEAGWATLCGRDAIHLRPAKKFALSARDFAALSARLPSGAKPKYNEFLIRFEIERCEVTLFADGRAIVKGTTDAAVARKIHAAWVG